MPRTEGWLERVRQWFTKSPSHCVAAHTLGRWGEAHVARLLARNGMKLLHRNWRVGRQELDLVLVDRNTLVVVEVKTRQSEWAAELGLGMRSGNGSSFESEEVVREAQLERIREATESYLERFAVRLKRLGVVQYRIEVMVVRLGGGEVRIKSSKICALTAW